MGDDSIFVLREFVIADRLDDIVEDGKDLVFKDKDGSEKVYPRLSSAAAAPPHRRRRAPPPLLTTLRPPPTDAGADG